MNANVRNILFDAVNFIYDALESNKDHIVLVHCDTGNVRSAVIAIAFIMKRK